MFILWSIGLNRILKLISFPFLMWLLENVDRKWGSHYSSMGQRSSAPSSPPAEVIRIMWKRLYTLSTSWPLAKKRPDARSGAHTGETEKWMKPVSPGFQSRRPPFGDTPAFSRSQTRGWNITRRNLRPPLRVCAAARGGVGQGTLSPSQGLSRGEDTEEKPRNAPPAGGLLGGRPTDQKGSWLG